MSYDSNRGNDYDPYYSGDNGISDIGGGLKRLQSGLQSESVNGIFGIPYQFLPSVDRRIYGTDSGMGRKYAEKIMTHAPLLMITPCRQKFMEGFNRAEQNSVIQDLISGEFHASGLEHVGRYYTSDYAEPEYYKAVNRMCSECAHFLGIEDEHLPDISGKKGSVRLGDINWQENKNRDIAEYFAARKCVVFYADGLVSLQDSFGNSTTESSLQSTINSFGDQAKELKFLLGGSSAEGLMDSASDIVSNITSGLGDLGGNLTAGMLGDLATNGVSVALAGGKMIFPKLWGDSQSSRSYSFDIKLRSPDHDTISIFMNILVPYIHLLALCLPQSITGEDEIDQLPNAYDTPFIVRAYCKGMFNINMGIVTDLSCTRGAEAQWNDAGLPTQMDVSISIEDLYSSLVMTNPGDSNVFNFFDLVTNTEMIDFLSNLSGLNVATTEITRRTKLVPFLMGQEIKRVPERIYNYFENGVSNLVRRIYDNIY